MVRCFSIWLLYAICLCNLLVAQDLDFAQGVDSDPQARLANLQESITKLRSEESLPEATRTAAISHLEDAISHLEQQVDFEKHAAEYKEFVIDGASELNQTEDDSSESGFPLPTGLSENSSMAELDEALTEEQASLINAKASLARLEEKVYELQASPAEIRDRLSTAKAELREIQKRIEEPYPSSGSIVHSAELTALQYQRDSLLAEIRLLEQKAYSSDLSADRAATATDAAKKKIEAINARIRAIQNLADTKVKTGLGQAEAVLERVEDLDSEVQSSLTNEVGELNELITEVRRVLGLINKTTKELGEREEVLHLITKDFENVKRQIELGGIEGAFAQILLERKQSLPDPLEERELIREILAQHTQAQRRLYFLRNDLELGSADGEENTPEDSAAMVVGRNEIVQDIKKVSNRLHQNLVASYRRLIRVLGELDVIEHQIDNVVREYREFLSRELFWQRSSPIMGPASFKSVPKSFVWAFGPERAREFAEYAAGIPLAFYIVLVVVVGLLVALRKKFKEALEFSGLQTRRISTDYYLNTIKAFVLTVLIALPIPLILMAFGMAFRLHSVATEWRYGIGTAFVTIGMFVFVYQFTKYLASEKGLGSYHFNWRPKNLASLHLLFRRMIPVYIPAWLLLCMVIGDRSPEYINGLGRLAALLTVLAIGMVFIVFAKPKSKGDEDAGEVHKDFLSGRGVFWTAICITVGLTALLVAGYVITSIILIVQIQVSILVVYSAFVIYGLIMRWFDLRERRIALAEAIAERRARMKEAEESEDDNRQQSEEVLIDEAEKDQSLSLIQVGTQMANVIRFMVGAGLLITLSFIWMNATPLLEGLDEIYLFDVFSIADLAVTILVIGFVVSVTRNLSGLLEILVYGHFDIENGTKTAVTTLIQYTVILIGSLVVFDQMNIDFSHLGWIAAALSVGLGFGLQEVVANFVCGIILLFERPIRVGDVVKINDISGTVSRIRMRATTIIDWDLEELVVPNKEFITGSLLNMTLSSPINRVVVPVGVAYGSDTAKVLKILSEVAAETEGVMDDPPPIITFEAFGESSLDFSIRAYLPNRDKRLGTITALHHNINARFAEAGITIPFPQRDLHLRSVDDKIHFGDKSKD